MVISAPASWAGDSDNKLISASGQIVLTHLSLLHSEPAVLSPACDAAFAYMLLLNPVIYST